MNVTRARALALPTADREVVRVGQKVAQAVAFAVLLQVRHETRPNAVHLVCRGHCAEDNLCQAVCDIAFCT
jgi:hypothetical protein